jgi:hypothetical protein
MVCFDVQNKLGVPKELAVHNFYSKTLLWFFAARRALEDN